MNITMEIYHDQGVKYSTSDAVKLG